MEERRCLCGKAIEAASGLEKSIWGSWERCDAWLRVQGSTPALPGAKAGGRSIGKGSVQSRATIAFHSCPGVRKSKLHREKNHHVEPHASQGDLEEDSCTRAWGRESAAKGTGDVGIECQPQCGGFWQQRKRQVWKSATK